MSGGPWKFWVFRDVPEPVYDAFCVIVTATVALSCGAIRESGTSSMKSSQA